MVTAKTIKLIRGLAEHKNRREENLFVAEGSKCVSDTLPGFDPVFLFCTEDWAVIHPEEIKSAEQKGAHIELCKKGQLRELSSLVATPPAIAVYHIPEKKNVAPEICLNELVVVLDRVQDPGNLGTIIRTADWMGIHSIVASKDTVDMYNPKVVQASMGAITRVKVTYVENLAIFLDEVEGCGANIYGTFLGGENIYSAALSPTGAIILGNEGSGISPEIEACVNRKLFIPPFPQDADTSESLNVATACAIVLSQFRSRQMKSRN